MHRSTIVRQHMITELRTLSNYYAVLAVYLLLLPHSSTWGQNMAPAWRCDRMRST